MDTPRPRAFSHNFETFPEERIEERRRPNDKLNHLHDLLSPPDIDSSGYSLSVLQF